MYRKIYGFIEAIYSLEEEKKKLWDKLNISETEYNALQQWWNEDQHLLLNIASSSDRVNFKNKEIFTNAHSQIVVKHPISGQQQSISVTSGNLDELMDLNSLDKDQLFWWLWRFLPELKAQQHPDNLLIPAHPILPDCPLHSYASTVSALTGAIYPQSSPENDQPSHPYLLLFTFSPVQEFIKASRKFVDFWSGSYILHYLGVKLCWHIAKKYGPDAIITPSLWGQEIIDALMINEFDQDDQTFFKDSFNRYIGSNPMDSFNDKCSSSLSTAGFPNIITVLVPSKEDAQALGKSLKRQIQNDWGEIALNVREDIKKNVIDYVENNYVQLWEAIADEFPDAEENAYQKELETFKQGGCWEWNKLWDAQINHTWESYFTAIPLGNPDQPLTIDNLNQVWQDAQKAIANPRKDQEIPSEGEEKLYTEFNVGTWWGAIQARLGQSIQAVKNTRSWSIPSAPGERSTLSGQYSAIHPRLSYQGKFTEGGGIRESSMRLFWRVMAEVYSGLFNGSEKLNAIELTKRMAWNTGGVAKSLGIKVTEIQREIIDNELTESETIDYESLIRFPNLSAIASAKFVYESPQKTKQYWNILQKLIKNKLSHKHNLFCSHTRKRPSHILKVDQKINPNNDNGQNFNGVMFSSKWLADDLGCNQQETQQLRMLVDQAHQEVGFKDASPSDWWVIVLGDGDGMGKYVSGRKLKFYQEYLNQDLIADNVKQTEEYKDLVTKTKKRMGPATHVGLNRALLDFSNRLVPYITQKRFCGKVVYSGGDDVMAVLPLTDLPEYLLSLRSAWCGGDDPFEEFSTNNNHHDSKDQYSGYWTPIEALEGLQKRPYFTMGEGATISLGMVIAHKSVPLPTVLESLWTAEKEKAKKIAGKDGLCFRVIYGGGNVLEALMKGSLLPSWWQWIKSYQHNLDLSPLLYRLAEELPLHACVTKEDKLISKAAKVIINKRDEEIPKEVKQSLINWLDSWENWVNNPQSSQNTTTDDDNSAVNEDQNLLGTDIQDLAKLLRFSSFWLDKVQQHQQWTQGGQN